MMADNEHSILKIASNLAMACFISGVVIGSVYYVTAPVAAEKAVQMKQESMKALVSDADSFQPVDGHEGWFAAMKGGAAKKASSRASCSKSVTGSASGCCR